VTSPRPLNDLLTGLSRVVFGLAVLAITAQAARYVEINAIWDDAYIFQRYAAQLADGHGVRWQPGGEPTYGLTSLAYLIPAFIAQKLAPDPAVAAVGACLFFGALFLLGSSYVIHKHVTGPPAARRGADLLVVVCIALSATPVHFATGMDTSFGMVFQLVHVSLALRFAADPNGRRAVALGLVGGLAMWVRPELLAFSFLIPAAFAFRPPPEAPQARRHALMSLGVAATTTAVLLIVNALYFGTALPLPFFAKSMARYDSGLGKPYRGVAVQHLLLFMGHYWPLFVIVAAELVGRGRRFLRTAAPLQLSLLAGLVVVLGYHALFALPVMGMSERFCQVAVVPLAILATTIVVDWAPTFEERLPDAATRTMVGLGGLVALLVLLWPKVVEELKETNWKLSRTHYLWDSQAHAKTKGPRSYWFRIDEMSALPPEVVFASTEVGFLGMLQPKRRVIDIAGLNEPRFSLEPFSPEVLLAEMKPDLIYMPHQDYGKMIKDIRRSPHFSAYEEFNKHRTKTHTFGIAVRRDSPHYDAIMAIAKLAPAPSRGGVKADRRR
jgi:hypothetical protein